MKQVVNSKDIVIGYIKPKEWVEYAIDTSEVNGKWESFSIQFNYGRGASGSSNVVVSSSGVIMGSTDLASTGAWDTHTSYTDDSIAVLIDSDCTTLRFEFVTGGIDLDYFVIIKSGNGKNKINKNNMGLVEISVRS